MAASSYFSGDALHVQTGQMIETAKGLKTRKIALEYEWAKFTASWRTLGGFRGGFVVESVSGKFNVRNPSQKMCWWNLCRKSTLMRRPSSASATI